MDAKHLLPTVHRHNLYRPKTDAQYLQEAWHLVKDTLWVARHIAIPADNAV